MASASGQRNMAMWNATQLGNNLAKGESLLNEYNRDRPLEQLQAGATRARGALEQYFPQALGALGKGYGQARTDYLTGRDSALGALGQGYGAARTDIMGGRDAAAGALGQGFGQSRTDIMGGRDAGLDALGQGFDRAGANIMDFGGATLGAIGGGFDRARGDINDNYDSAMALLGMTAGNYEPWRGTGANANTAVGDFMGLNGGAGGSAARDALANYRASTGYGDIVNEATDAAARKANALGMTASGNTLDAITRIGGQLADRSAQGYLDRLMGLSGQGLTAAGAQGQAFTGMANMSQRRGDVLAGQDIQRAGLEGQTLTGMGDSLARMAQGQGAAEAGIYGSTADALARAAQGEGAALGNLYASTGSQLGQLGVGQGAAEAGLYSATGDALGRMGVGQGAAESALYSGMGSSLAGLESQLGRDSAGVYQGLGNALVNLNNGTAQQLAADARGVGQAGDAAKMANQNLTMGLVGQALGLLGGFAGMPGGTPGLGSLGSLFGGGAPSQLYTPTMTGIGIPTGGRY